MTHSWDGKQRSDCVAAGTSFDLGELSQVMSCVLSACSGEWEQRGTLEFLVCSPWPGLNTGWIQGASGGILLRLVAAGAGSGTPCKPLPSSAAVAVLGLGCGRQCWCGSVAVLTSSGFCAEHRSWTADLRGKGRRSSWYHRECF